MRLGGLNGLLLLNVLLLAGVFCCTYAFAAERLPPAGALLVASGFLGASAAPLYAVWLMPETFNMSLVFYAYFLWLFKEVRTNPTAGRSFLTDHSSDLVAAVLLGLVTFSKPSNLLLILPLVALAVWRRQIRQGLLIGVVFAAVVGAGFGITALTSGEFNYQGGDRKTFSGHYPFEDGQANFDALGNPMTTNALPTDVGRASFLGQLGRNTVYFFVGRHFGLIPYFMPGIVILGWALWRRRTLAVWHLLIGIAVAGTAVGLLVLLPNTWSGGGGPVGNRYFLSCYPALFFLLPAGRSALPGVILWVAGALFTAQILVDPFVAAKRTWQHAEQGLFRTLPVELTMVNDLPVRLDQGRSRIPYGSDPTLLLSYLDRNAWRPDTSGIWIAGDARGEIIVLGQSSALGIGGHVALANPEHRHRHRRRQQTSRRGPAEQPGEYPAPGARRLRRRRTELRPQRGNRQRLRAAAQGPAIARPTLPRRGARAGRHPEGTDAPICQDGRSGGFTELLARAEVSHDALIDFPSEKAFKASDDVPFRPSIRPASDDIVDRRLVIAHTDHDGSMEGGVRLSVAAPIEAVSTGGHPRGGGDGTRAAELGKGGFRANPLRVIPEDN